MRLEHFYRSDAIAIDSGFVRNGADDIAHANLIAFANREKDALFATGHGWSALSDGQSARIGGGRPGG